MKNNVMEKQFDCIAVKNSIQKQIYDETKNMTAYELLQYFNGNSKSKMPSIKKNRVKVPV